MRFIVALTSALGGALSIAHAGQPNESQLEQAEFSMPVGPNMVAITFPQFDPQGGQRVLHSVAFTLDSVVGANVTAENDSQQSIPQWTLRLSGFISAQFGSVDDFGVISRIAIAGPIAPSDGNPGSGPDFWDFGFVNHERSRATIESEDLAPFLGTGTIDATVFVSAGFTLTPISNDITYIIDNFTATGSVQVEYQYRTKSLPCPGDLDGSGAVDFDDFTQLLASWGKCPEGNNCPADIDGDHDVDFDDFTALLAAWGRCP